MTSSKETGFHVDEPALFEKLPYKVTSTNLKGVYANPTPPGDLGIHEASQADLASHGLLLPKPDASLHPQARILWSRLSSPELLMKGRIVPQSEPQPGKTHILKVKPVRQDDTTFTGNVWAGPGTNQGSWRSISGHWEIPTVSVPPEPQGSEGGWHSSSWIGIDGMFTSEDVLQAGIEQRVSADGTASYVAWYEWYAPQISTSPDYIHQTNIVNFPVSPGQKVSCAVQYVDQTAGNILFINNDTGQNFNITLAPPPNATFNGSSVEWIMEAPDSGEPVSSLPSFTPVVFTGCLAWAPGGTTTITPQSCDIMNIVDANGKALTAVSVSGETATISFIG